MNIIFSSTATFSVYVSFLEQSNRGVCVYVAHPFRFRLSLEQPQSPVNNLSAAMMCFFP